MLDLAVEADDESLLEDVQAELDSAEKALGDLEFRRMFSNPMDPNPCFLEIQSGSGGTEAQDWASMLLRMYLRWIERHGFKGELMEVSDGDVAGIKSATIRVDGEFAYGWLRTESGVHRLVRKSPFDSNNNRHTSFSAVFISPEIDDNIEIDINPSDVRTDTYRGRRLRPVARIGGVSFALSWCQFFGWASNSWGWTMARQVSRVSA